MEVLKKAIEVAALLFSDLKEEERKKKLVEIGMDVWEMIDPTPNFDLDDQIVEILLYHVADMAIDAVEKLKN